MTRFSSLLLPIAFTLPASTAFADITPQQVWDSLNDFNNSLGVTYNADIEQTGDTLIARNLVITSTAFESTDVASNITFPEMILKGTSTGDVIVTLPQAGLSTTTLSGAFAEGLEEVTSEVTMTLDGPIVVSGSPNDVLFTFKENAISYVMGTQTGTAANPLQTLDVILAGISGTAFARQDNDLVLSGIDMTAASMTYKANMQSNETPPMTLSYSAGPLTVSGTSQNDDAALEDSAKAFQSLAMDLSYGLENMTFDVLVGPAEQSTHINGTTASSALDLKMDAGVIAYETRAENLELALEGSAIPFPDINFGLESAAFGVTMPYIGNGAPQEAGIQLALEKLRAPEILWAILDPTNQLPHDPATLRLDASGVVLSELNLLDPASMTALVERGDKPLTGITASLNELLLTFAGAQLNADAAATFAQDGSKFPNGVPAADVQAHIELSGSTALMDALTAIGMLPPQMATAAKTMLALFATPTETPDGFETDVALTKDGALTVNGMPLPF